MWFERQREISVVCWRRDDGWAVKSMDNKSVVVVVVVDDDVNDAFCWRSSSDAAQLQLGGRSQSGGDVDMRCRGDWTGAVLQADWSKPGQGGRDRRVRGDPGSVVWLLWRARAEPESPGGVCGRWYGEVVAKSTTVERTSVQRGQPHHQPRTGLHSAFFSSEPNRCVIVR